MTLVKLQDNHPASKKLLWAIQTGCPTVNLD